MHAPMTSISRALYLSSAVLSPCPEPSSQHEGSHIKAALGSTCTDETPSHSGRLTPHSATLNTFHFITAPLGKKKKREQRRCCLKGTSCLICRRSHVSKIGALCLMMPLWRPNFSWLHLRPAEVLAKAIVINVEGDPGFNCATIKM